jgi:hypothetical protein
VRSAHRHSTERRNVMWCGGQIGRIPISAAAAIATTAAMTASTVIIISLGSMWAVMPAEDYTGQLAIGVTLGRVREQAIADALIAPALKPPAAAGRIGSRCGTCWRDLASLLPFGSSVSLLGVSPFGHADAGEVAVLATSKGGGDERVHRCNGGHEEGPWRRRRVALPKPKVDVRKVGAKFAKAHQRYTKTCNGLERTSWHSLSRAKR